MKASHVTKDNLFNVLLNNQKQSKSYNGYKCILLTFSTVLIRFYSILLMFSVFTVMMQVMKTDKAKNSKFWKYEHIYFAGYYFPIFIKLSVFFQLKQSIHKVIIVFNMLQNILNLITSTNE